MHLKLICHSSRVSKSSIKVSIENWINQRIDKKSQSWVQANCTPSAQVLISYLKPFQTSRLFTISTTPQTWRKWQDKVWAISRCMATKVSLIFKILELETPVWPSQQYKLRCIPLSTNMHVITLIKCQRTRIVQMEIIILPSSQLKVITSRDLDKNSRLLPQGIKERNRRKIR